MEFPHLLLLSLLCPFLHFHSTKETYYPNRPTLPHPIGVTKLGLCQFIISFVSKLFSELVRLG